MIFSNLFGTKVKNIDSKEVKKKLDNENVQIVDVRFRDEYKQGHIPGAINIPYPKLKQNLNKVDETKEIIMVCTAGIRSKKATKKLLKEGYDNVLNMSGGMRNWKGKIE